MPRKWHSEEQIVYAVRQIEGGKKVSEICGFGAFMRGKIGFVSQVSRVETVHTQLMARRRKWPPQKRAAISIQRCADT